MNVQFTVNFINKRELSENIADKVLSFTFQRRVALVMQYLFELIIPASGANNANLTFTLVKYTYSLGMAEETEANRRTLIVLLKINGSIGKWVNSNQIPFRNETHLIKGVRS